MEYSHFALTLVTAPALEPVTLAEVKTHLRVEHDLENALIESLITAARNFVENFTRRALIEQSWKLTLDQFPCWEIYLPKPPLISITKIEYLNSLGIADSLTETIDFLVDKESEPARVTPFYLGTWPIAYQQINAVSITFKCGYGALAAAVPTAIKQSMLLLIGHWYNNREQTAPINLSQIPLGAEYLLWPYRDFRV